MKKRFLALLLSIVLCLLTTSCSPTYSGKEDEAVPKEQYYFVLYNSLYLTDEDWDAISVILKLYPSHDVFGIDTKDFTDAVSLYSYLREESKKKTGKLDGVQIIGTADMVPSFVIDYKIKIPDGFAEGKSFFSDYFYSNFENEDDMLLSFNIADAFSSGNVPTFIPTHRVTRLLLGSGELSAYLEHYEHYVQELSAVPPELACFSSSIFRYGEETSADDFAYFLHRAENEWKVIKDVNVYTNRQGEYLSPVASLGDVGAENLKKEGECGVKEFFLAGHGSTTAVYRTVFSGDTETQTPFLEYSQIRDTLSEKPCFLNIHACSTAFGLGENLVREAMRNGCIAALAATSEIANNGIDCKADLSNITGSANFFGFHYAYLAERNQGSPHSDAFFNAQVSFATALAECAQKEIDYAANYQFGYHNLLAFARFGILESELSSFPKGEELGASSANIPIEKNFVNLTSGRETGKSTQLRFELLQGNTSFVRIADVSAYSLDNGYVRFYVDACAQPPVTLRLIGNIGPYLPNRLEPAPILKNGLTLVFDLPREELSAQGALGLYFVSGGQSALWIVYGVDDLT